MLENCAFSQLGGDYEVSEDVFPTDVMRQLDDETTEESDYDTDSDAVVDQDKDKDDDYYE